MPGTVLGRGRGGGGVHKAGLKNLAPIPIGLL